ncbi:hypothetical protein MKZ38_004672 [Zalerion maritima]|uniref:Uncharacterized protein n=1 Tax=Zalerion maritima TaxID=339359 RepID=A0AAD5RLL7_9PEZI|nr:hypothetical protein MKZ38_004672 [Zalerion maritima]
MLPVNALLVLAAATASANPLGKNTNDGKSMAYFARSADTWSPGYQLEVLKRRTQELWQGLTRHNDREKLEGRQDITYGQYGLGDYGSYGRYNGYDQFPTPTSTEEQPTETTAFEIIN